MTAAELWPSSVTSVLLLITVLLSVEFLRVARMGLVFCVSPVFGGLLPKEDFGAKAVS